MTDPKNTTVFDPKALQERVASVVKQSMFDLMPDEQFEGLVQKEMKAFFEDESKKLEVTKYHTGYGQENKWGVTAACSPFRLMVWAILQEEFGKKLLEVRDSDLWKTGLQQVWDHEGTHYEGKLEEAMQKRFEAMSATMAQQMFQKMMIQSVENLKSEMINNPSMFGIPNQY